MGDFDDYGMEPEEDPKTWEEKYGPEDPGQQFDEVAHLGTVVRADETFQCNHFPVNSVPLVQSLSRHPVSNLS